MPSGWRRACRLDSTLQKSAVEIRTSATRAAQLTDRLLSLGQRQVLEPRSLDLPRLVADLRNAIQRRVGASVTLVIRRGRRSAPVRADRMRLIHVLAHLVDNAREAMPDGGQLTISTGPARRGRGHARGAAVAARRRLRAAAGRGHRHRHGRRVCRSRVRAVRDDQAEGPRRRSRAGNRLRSRQAEQRLRVGGERATGGDARRRAAAGRRRSADAPALDRRAGRVDSGARSAARAARRGRRRRARAALVGARAQRLRRGHRQQRRGGARRWRRRLSRFC